MSAQSARVQPELITDEQALVHAGQFGDAIRARMLTGVVALTAIVVSYASGLLAGHERLALALPVAGLLVNATAEWLRVRGRVAWWHFWTLLAFDALMLGGGVVLLGAEGYLGAVFFVAGAAAYALRRPRAAVAWLALAAVIYPLARVLALRPPTGGLPPGSAVGAIAAELVCMLGLGWLVTRSPTLFTRRVRRARRALGALEHGDFTVRLPARAHDDLGFLAASFNRTAAALGEDAARLTEAEREARHMAARMRAVAGAAAGVLAPDSEEALQALLRKSCEAVLPLDFFGFGLYDADARALHYLADPWVDEPACTVTLSGRPAERVVRERRSLMTLRADDPAAAGTVLSRDGRRSESIVCTPILDGDAVLGVLSVQSYTPDAYGPADVEVLEAVAALAATALQNLRLVRQLRASEAALARQAHHDPLTGLANRALFRERVERALGRAATAPGRVAVLFLDLDDFKTVNDSLGHAAGDQLLVEVAARLLNATRGADTVARLGGDEFAVLLENARDDADTQIVARRILSALSAPVELARTAAALSVGASIGVARARAGDGPDELIRNADVAMYMAKGRGKHNFELFAPEMHAAVVERLELEADLRRAVEHEAFTLLYQPIVELATGAVTGVEALIRWHHPRRGAVPPSVFVPIAEAAGLIVPLGRWVLDAACRQAATWARTRKAAGLAPFVMSVNVSARQLDAGAELVEHVRGALAASGLPAAALQIEITETVMMLDAEAAAAVLDSLSALGVRVAVDDFGTGYSSLTYLERFPVDVLKIDKRFVDRLGGPADSPLAEAVIRIAHALGLTVVAEGIESAAQAARLEALGCRHGQGYLYARPLSAADAAAFAGLPPAPADESCVVTAGEPVEAAA